MKNPPSYESLCLYSLRANLLFVSFYEPRTKSHETFFRVHEPRTKYFVQYFAMGWLGSRVLVPVLCRSYCTVQFVQYRCRYFIVIYIKPNRNRTEVTRKARFLNNSGDVRKKRCPNRCQNVVQKKNCPLTTIMTTFWQRWIFFLHFFFWRNFVVQNVVTVRVHCNVIMF